MSDLVMKDRVLLQMHQDAAAGTPSTQLSLATSLGTSRAQICNALKKLTHRGLLVKGELLGAPPNRGTYSYRLTPAGQRRAKELEGEQ
jgi:predicted transcriptional regulator